MAVNLPAVYALSALSIVAFALSSAPNWFRGVGWIAALAPFASMLGSAAIFGSLYFANGPLKATEDAGTLRVTEGRIELSGKVLGIVSELGSAVLIPSASQGMLVRLVYKKRKQPLTLRVEDITQGRALLRALALDATKTTSTFAVRPSTRGQQKLRRGLIGAALAGAVATVCVPFLAGTGHPSDLFPLLMVGLCVSMAALVAANVPSKATVGADGILFRYLWSKTFLPLAQIHSADVAEGAKERPVARLRLAD